MASTDRIENPFTFMKVQYKNTNEIAKAKIKAKQKSYYPCMPKLKKKNYGGKSKHKSYKILKKSKTKS